jgi:predicted PurR-regulated permease PerM
MSPEGRWLRVLLGVAAAIWVLSTARGVLQPLAIAALVWFLLEAATAGFRRLLPGSGGLARAAAVATLAAALIGLGAAAAGNAQAIAARLPAYEARLDALVAGWAGALGLEDTLYLGRLLAKIDFGALALGAAGSAAGYLAGLVIVLCYLAFLLVEVGAFEGKLAAIAPDPARRARTQAFLAAAHASIVRYFGATALVGLAQAIPTFLLLSAVGVSAPLFWASLIFALSFVPTVGTMIGIAFPAAITLLEFDTLGPFLIVAPALAAVQLLGSNWLQPKLMGAALDLSPLAVLLAIFAGGALWGVVGALLAVPSLSVAVLFCAQDEELRPVALALSAKGKLPEAVAPPAR